MKKILTSVIVGVLVLAMVPFSAFAEENTVANETEQQNETVVSEDTASESADSNEEETVNVSEEETADVLAEETAEAVTDEETVSDAAEETADEVAEEEVTQADLDLNNDAEAYANENIAAPELISTGNVAEGIEVRYTAVDGAESYNIYRKTENGTDFKLIASSVSGTAYTDTKVVTGVSYCYTVSAVSSKGKESGYDETGISLVCVKPVKVIKAAKKNGVINLKWTKLSRADGYYVYLVENGQLNKIATIKKSSVKTYEYKVKESGTYQFVVRPYVKSDGTIYKSWWDESFSKTVTYMATPKFAVKSTAKGIKITITGDSMAYRYRIYRKVNGGDWDLIKSTGKTVYVDKDLSSGNYYTYTVKSVAKNKTKSAAKVNGKSKGWMTAPTISAISSDGTAVNLTWTASEGATKYIIYRKTAKSGYQRIGASKDTNFRDKTVKSSTTYRYYVVAAGKIGGKIWKSFYSGKITKKVRTVTSVKGIMISKAQAYSSPYNYLVMIDCTNNILGVFTGSQGNWKPLYFWRCSTGAAETPTVKGVFSLTGNKGYVFGDGYSCYYYSGFYGGYLIHSILYWPGTFNPMDATIGGHVSHGCVRLPIQRAKWIYDTLPTGTTVVTY